MATINSAALDELNSAETRTLFDTADKLSSLGIGRIVNLPQIIVVGDQSSGKSSTLEAISNVHFPVEGEVCTRFATELVLRPSTRRSVAATVHFANGTSPAHSLHIVDFKQEDIHGIIKDAKDKMGISGNNTGFSKDILRLEIEGPGMYPLTLVDLPGIFHAATAKQSVEDKGTVMELVESYMKKPNSIILAIISANNQLANQAVMQEATKHDPTRMRTLGVITKPDLLPPGSSSEIEYLQLVRGRDPVYSQGLGWHVLRNRADYESNSDSRETVEEQFFKSGSWASVSETNRGVTSLRAKLSRVLLDHIKKGLPALLEDLQDRLSERQVELSRLGQPRNSPEDMRSYLIDIASGFERLAHDGIQGRYNNPFFYGMDGRERRLRAQLRNFSKALRHVFLTFGCSQELIEQPGWTRPRASVAPEYLGDFMETHKYTNNLRCPRSITRADLTTWLERQAAAYQGTEFPGYANMNVVIRFFQAQTKPWQCIAEMHLQKVIGVTKAFVEAVFEYIVGPFSSNSTTRAILSTLVDDFFDAKEQALSAKLKELLRPYQDGYALPLDADFHETMEQRAAERAAISGGPMVNSELEKGTARSSESSSEFGTERIIDTVQIFYDMALRTFTDNVINLAVESCLVQDLPNIFTARLVSNMDNGELEKLAAESQEVHSSRVHLEEDIRLLKEGLERCRPYKPRANLTMSSARAMSTEPHEDASVPLPRRVKVKMPPSNSQADQEAHAVSQTTSSAATQPHTAPTITRSDQTAPNSPSVSGSDSSDSSLFGSSPFRPGVSDPTTGQTTPPAPGKSQAVINNGPMSAANRDGKTASLFASVSKQQVSTSPSTQPGKLFPTPSGAASATTPSKTVFKPGGLFDSAAASSPASANSAAGVSDSFASSVPSIFASLSSASQPPSTGVFGISPAATSPSSKAVTAGTRGPFAHFSQPSSNPFAEAIARGKSGGWPNSGGSKLSGPPPPGASSM